MSKAETWARRVAEWQASGQSSAAYCEGQEFTAGGLRHWAHRLRAAKAEPRATVRMLRVERVATPAEPARPTSVASGVAVRVGGIDVVVECGFDRATLAAVLAVVTAGHGA